MDPIDRKSVVLMAAHIRLNRAIPQIKSLVNFADPYTALTMSIFNAGMGIVWSEQMVDTATYFEVACALATVSLALPNIYIEIKHVGQSGRRVMTSLREIHHTLQPDVDVALLKNEEEWTLNWPGVALVSNMGLVESHAHIFAQGRHAATIRQIT